MDAYHALLQHIIDHGEYKLDRTGVGTYTVFGTQTRYDMERSFPLLTSKKVNIRAVLVELLWFLRGDTNIEYLHSHGVHIWDEWADENGDLGPVYGQQWRHWAKKDGSHIDQIANVINDLRSNPESRRLIVSAWNPEDVPKMAIPPCHTMFHFNTRRMSLASRNAWYARNVSRTTADENLTADTLTALGVPVFYLDCLLYQRSADMFLGVPFNIASYAALTMAIAKLLNMQAGDFVHTTGDTHIYVNHMEQVREQLSRSPIPLPTMRIEGAQETIDDFRLSDFVLDNYEPHPVIRGAVAV